MAENLIVDEFLAREFTRDVAHGFEWRYKLSIAIGERFLKSSPVVADESIRAVMKLAPPGSTVGGLEAAGIVYPSVATKANDDNVALKARIADECLQFAWAHYLEIHRSGKSDEFTPVGIDFANSVTPDGAINWQGNFPSSVCPATDLRLSMHNNQLVMIDSLGHIAGAFPSGINSPK